MKKSKQQIRASKYGISGAHNPPKTELQHFGVAYGAMAIMALKEQSELFDKWSKGVEKKLQDALQINPSASECDILCASFVHDAQEASEYCRRAYELLNKYLINKETK